MTTKYEKQKSGEGFSFVIGCDEVGRGCLAGPVVAAAVVFPGGGGKLKVESYKVIKSAGIADSKILSPDKREELSALIKQHAWWGIGVVEKDIIDQINIHHASLLAMKKAVENLLASLSGVILRNASDEESQKRDPSSGLLMLKRTQDDAKKVMLVVDGKFAIPGLSMTQEAVVDADAKILSVAAASIVAKVYRDDLMRRIHVKYPQYGLDRHKGYATLYHRQAIKKFGLTEIHRRSFCRQYV